MKRNKGSKLYILLFLSIILCLVIYFIYSFILKSPSNQAEEAVEEFYSYEAKGAYAESWEMFHPFMKERFEKGDYLQDRPHVFLNHFGVNTFTFQIEDAEKIEGWQIEEDSETIEVVYKVTVSQRFEGRYGNFEIVQDVFTTDIDGEWTVLWDYKKSETSSVSQ
ncbi:hypothetical protein [Ornithinibacillus scapharcae]|uniref:hypothetical protein n=1 Tax=Ornithinibacillus scapharcae TaxID=1147159 RepID=UPI000225AD6A|nr:hypothetical protein [Ornithinibacillus scapharcae]